MGTTAIIWCKDGVTDGVETTVGLKQGCILSALLFSLFVNDLPEFLEGDCNFKGVKVKTLLYADNIVLIAPTANKLQVMIYNLETYFDFWNLKVNLSKSKIMIFRIDEKLSFDDN